MKRLYFAIELLWLAGWLWLAAGAAAHAILVKSEPADGAILNRPPERVIAWFSQELDTGSSSLRLLDAAGRQVDNGDGGVDLNDPDHTSMIVTLPATLPGGRYTAHWTVVSMDDGDATEGEFQIAIGQEEAVAHQTTPVQNQPVKNRADWLVGSIVVGLGILLLAVIWFILRPRVTRNG